MEEATETSPYSVQTLTSEELADIITNTLSHHQNRLKSLQDGYEQVKDKPMTPEQENNLITGIQQAQEELELAKQAIERAKQLQSTGQPVPIQTSNYIHEVTWLDIRPEVSILQDSSQ